jgi:hypothetical protein
MEDTVKLEFINKDKKVIKLFCQDIILETNGDASKNIFVRYSNGDSQLYYGCKKLKIDGLVGGK